MNILVVLQEAIIGSFKSIFGIALIVFPLMMVLEIVKDLNILDRLSAVIRPVSRLFNIPQEAGLPLLAGLIFGITYGAGTIIQSAREGKLTKRDLVVVNTFLVICHAVFEDTMLFVAVGANGYLILLFRLMMAVVVTFLVSRYVKITENFSSVPTQNNVSK